MKTNRLKRGAALIYVAATGTGVTLMLGGLTMFTAEASRKDHLTTESVIIRADSDGLFEKGRLIVRETSYTINPIDELNLEVEGTNDGVAAKTTMTDLIMSDRPLTVLETGLIPFELTNRQGLTGVYVEPISDALYLARVKQLVLGLPLGDAAAFPFPADELQVAQNNGYQWVRGGKMQTLRTGVNGTNTATYRGSRRSNQQVTDLDPVKRRIRAKTMFSEMPGSVKLATAVQGDKSLYSRNRVVGVPYAFTDSISKLSVRSYAWKGTGPTAIAHMDLKVGTPRPSSVSEGLVESRLGPQGFPIATTTARHSVSPATQYRAFSPTTYELLWWRQGQSGTRFVDAPTTSQTSVPFNWAAQSLPNDVQNNPQYRMVHLSGAFDIASINERAALTMSLTAEDDAWVFINGQLAMDMGGLHSTMTSTRLNRNPVVVGRNRIDIFHANRGGTSTLGFNTNTILSPEAPFPLVTDNAFDTLGATIVGGAISTHSEVVDGGQLDADTVAVTLNPPGNTSSSYSLTYDANSVTGMTGKKFSTASVSVSIHSSAWAAIQDVVQISTGQTQPELVLQAYQRDLSTDAWRPVPVTIGQVSTNGSYKRLTLMTDSEALTDRYVSLVFNPDLAKIESAVKVNHVAFAHRVGDRALPLLLTPPTTGTADFLFSVGGELHVQDLGSTAGSIFANKLKITGSPWTVTGNVNVKDSAASFATNPLLTIVNGRLRAATHSPVPFVLNRTSFEMNANAQMTGNVTLTGVLNPPAGESNVALLIEGNATVDNLSIPSGGTIFVTGDLTILNSVTTDPNRNIQWLVKKSITIPDTAASGLSLQRQILCAEGDINIQRPIVFSGAMKTNRNLTWFGQTGFAGGGGAFAPLDMNGGGFSLD
ncbi:MAG TPA: hypothetical protein PLB31_02465 [Fimbriimonadaceae bacterium]|nr:hypothetical protein [Armatimonadota bacterium]HCM73043.1 hypothetical protein [Armatimonadota bacterium]HRD31817.1 hypothetical protein [Fimbriimonadaceae bacterium]HRE94903.1 hypothetical protein [Fimbriimonadaceae bacterium]HRI73313.1 hypothetical protein [Fimbriimonadaceae bacterium]